MGRIKGVLALHPDLFLNRLIWAACSTDFFGFLRCGECLTPDQEAFDPTKHLALSDLSLDQGSLQWHIKLSIAHSKMDQFHRGATVILGVTGQSM